jgi:hypothetical protein
MLVGQPTTFRLTNLPGASAWTVETDGPTVPSTTMLSRAELEVTTTIGTHRYVVHPS